MDAIMYTQLQDFFTEAVNSDHRMINAAVMREHARVVSNLAINEGWIPLEDRLDFEDALIFNSTKYSKLKQRQKEQLK